MSSPRPRLVRPASMALILLAACSSSKTISSAAGGAGSGNPEDTGGATGVSGASSGGAAGSSASGGAATGGANTAGRGGNAGAAPAGWPDATNTGVPDGACPSGLKAATADEITPQSNATIECVRFVDDVPYVRQDVKNVTYRFCRFESTTDVFLNLQGGPISIEDSEFSGPAGTWIRAVYSANGLVVKRSDFSGMANAIEFGTSDVVIEDNYVHDFGNVSQDQHADGFQTEGADRFSIIHNTVLFNDVWGSTSALLVQGTASIVRNNLVAGGGYTIHVAGDLQVTDNQVSTQFHATSGQYGPVYPESLAATGAWKNNVWHDGPNAGTEIPAP